MSDAVYLNLEAGEAIVVTAAAQIYAAYISAGRVQDGTEAGWIARSVDEALAIAKRTDERVLTRSEMG
jgi:hypothetical protein